MSNQPTDFAELHWADHTWLLLPGKAVFWPSEKCLLLGDTHFGKATHFRKAGIPVSDQVFLSDLNRLQQLLERWTPDYVLILGDFFHSEANAERQRLAEWMQHAPVKHWKLVPGNHDLLTLAMRDLPRLELLPSIHRIRGVSFSHQAIPSEGPLVCGHLHPGVTLVGKARQKVSLPCFHLTDNTLFLPAFSRFTGLDIIRPAEGDLVFASTGTGVFQVPLQPKATGK